MDKSLKLLILIVCLVFLQSFSDVECKGGSRGSKGGKSGKSGSKSGSKPGSKSNSWFSWLWPRPKPSGSSSGIGHSNNGGGKPEEVPMWKDPFETTPEPVKCPTEEDRKKYGDLDFFKFLQKPFKISDFKKEELKKKLQEHDEKLKFLSKYHINKLLGKCN